eukprot:Rhum_TRINITY_DN12983_c0_g2::Rhum_TRINITY_DN12983_c0_g2_i2::g.55966::m.55966/K20858/MCU; calcium uniporter protein, mitochondrial
MMPSGAAVALLLALATAATPAAAAAAAAATATAAAPSVPAPPTLAPTLGEVQNRKRALRLQDQLLHSGLEIISHDEYLQHSGSVGLTRKDADSVLADLDDSGAVHVSGGAIHLYPSRMLDAVNAKLGLPAADPCPEVTRLLAVLTPEFEALDEAKTKADLEVAQARLRFWSVCAVGTAVQMAGFSYLTFPTLSGEACMGWDDIEPISFFVTQGYICMWFLYFYMTRREHTLVAFDEQRMYKMSLRSYERRKVNIHRWAELRQELADLNGQKQKYTARYCAAKRRGDDVVTASSA